jgi:phosphate-selective porin OprO/OprP
MKLKLTLISFAFILFASVAKAQTSDDVLNLLVAKGTITQHEADSLRADYAIKQQDIKAKQTLLPVNSFGKLSLDGYTQVRYQYFQNQTVVPANGFDVRRARLDLTGSIGSQFDFRTQIDFGGTAVTPLDLYIVYKPFKDYLKFTAGQFYVPFSVENVTSDKSLDFIDRSQVVNALVARKGDGSNNLVDSIGNQNGRDVGLQASGSLISFNGGKFVDYYVALLNGAGINAVDNNKSKDIATRVVIHPFKVLDLGASYYNGSDKFTSPAPLYQDRIRWGGELAFNYKAFTLRSEIIAGQDGNTLQKHIDHEGGYAQAGYFFVPQKFQFVLKYDTYDPNTTHTGSQSTYYIAGVNYFFNSWAKLQVDYRKADGKGAINSNNDLFSTQLQIAF